MKQIQVNTQKDSIAIVLVGNKCDVDNRQVSTEEGSSVASEYGLKYFETSAMNNINITESFEYLTQDVMRIKDYRESGIQTDSKVNNRVKIDENNKKKEKKGCC
jgi:GTPase KRas protein